MSMRERLGSFFASPSSSGGVHEEPETKSHRSATPPEHSDNGSLAATLLSFARRHEHVFFTSRQERSTSVVKVSIAEPPPAILASNQLESSHEAIHEEERHHPSADAQHPCEMESTPPTTVTASSSTTLAQQPTPPAALLPSLESQFVRVRSRTASPIATPRDDIDAVQNVSVHRRRIDANILHHFGGYTALVVASQFNHAPSLVFEEALRARDVSHAQLRPHRWPLLHCVAELISKRYFRAHTILVTGDEGESLGRSQDASCESASSPVRTGEQLMEAFRDHDTASSRLERITSRLSDFFHSYDPKHVPTATQIEVVARCGIPESILFSFLRLRFGLPLHVEVTVLSAALPAPSVLDKTPEHAVPSDANESDGCNQFIASPDFGVSLDEAPEVPMTPDSQPGTRPLRPRNRGSSIATWPVEWRDAVMPLVVHIMGGEFAPSSRAHLAHIRARSWSANDGQDSMRSSMANPPLPRDAAMEGEGIHSRLEMKEECKPVSIDPLFLKSETPSAKILDDGADDDDDDMNKDVHRSVLLSDDEGGRRWNSTASRHGLANPLSWFPAPQQNTQRFIFFGVTHQISHDTCDVTPYPSHASAFAREIVGVFDIPVRQSQSCLALENSTATVTAKTSEKVLMDELLPGPRMGQLLLDTTLSWSSSAALIHKAQPPHSHASKTTQPLTPADVLSSLFAYLDEDYDYMDLGTLVQCPVLTTDISGGAISLPYEAKGRSPL